MLKAARSLSAIHCHPAPGKLLAFTAPRAPALMIVGGRDVPPEDDDDMIPGGAAAAAAAALAGGTPVFNLFRQWVAALNWANELGISDAECDRRADAATAVEDCLVAMPVHDVRDVAIKAWVCLHSIDSFTCPDVPGLLNEDANMAALAVQDACDRIFPELRAIVTGGAA